MSETRFTPVRGFESTILEMPYSEGYLYFAIDTKKIFLDSNGQGKIPMGGGGGSAAGSGVIIGSRQISIEEENQESIEFTTTDMSINFLPSVDAIILNVPDGCFYRVTSIRANSVVATRLTVAGGGGGGSSSSTKLTLDPISGIRTGQTYVLGQSANIEFEGTVDNGDTSLIYLVTVINTYAGNESTKQYGPFTVAADKHFIFDLGSILQLGTNTVQVQVTSDNAGYSVKKNYSLLNCVEMYLREELENFNPLKYFKGDFNFYCTPVGANLTKNIDIYIDDVLISEISKRNITTESSLQQFTIPGQSHGIHTLRAILSCEESAATTELEYNVCCIEDNVDIPLIWTSSSLPTTIINHDKLTIEYMVYNPNHSTGIEMHYYINNSEIPTSPLEVDYSQSSWLKWRVIGYEVGENVFTLKTSNTTLIIPIEVLRDTKRDLDIVTSGLHVNLDATGRSNNENSQSRSTWTSQSLTDNNITTTVKFNNFNWYNNGWITDINGDTCLRISNGASIEIPLNVMNTRKIQTALGFELVFKVRNVQNYSTLINTVVSDPDAENPKITKVVSSTDGVWGNYYNNNIGFCLGTQEAFFKTKDTLVSGRYKEDELVHVSFVIESENSNSNANKLIYMYINGINSGITKYNYDTDTLASNCQKVVINSDYCDIDLYKFRVYKANLTAQYVVQNYLADYNSAELYDMNQEIVDYNNGIPSINFNKMVQYNETHPDALLMPYMIIETTDIEDTLPYVKREPEGWTVNIEFVNPTLDYEYNNNLWGTNAEIKEKYNYNSKEEMYIHSCPSYKAVGVELNVQGTSSMGYPIRNYKAKFKERTGIPYSWIYTNPNFVDSSDNPIKMDKGGTTKKGFKVGKKFFMDSWIGENKTTLKADYMDSSSCHNTGFATLVKTAYSKHPLQDYEPEGLDPTKLRTSVYGFPILLFNKKHDGTYRFLGRYNYNLDKGCDDSFGFCDFGNDHYVDVTSLVTAENFNYKKLYTYNQAEDSYLGLTNSDTFIAGTSYFRLDKGQDSNALNEDYDPTDPYSRQYLPWSEAAECWELQNNQGGRCSFQYSDFSEIGPNGLLTVLDDFEYRYHIDADSIDNCLRKDQAKPKGLDFRGASNDQVNNYMLTKLRRFERLCDWLQDCNKSLATNEPLEEPYVTDIETYTTDSAAYRLAKFKKEFSEHLDKEYCVVYYVLTELLLCYDSRGKNLMMATWGPHERGGNDIWYPIFYDIDTQLGVNNSGVPYWDYYEEASENGIFSTPNSVLWNNLWDCFSEEIKNKFTELTTDQLSIANLNGYYNFNPEVSKSRAMAGYRPIIINNVDEYQKYIAPSVSGFQNTSNQLAISDAFYYCLQGTRELQRALFLRNRYNYLGSKWVAGTYTINGVAQGLNLRGNFNAKTDTSDKYLNIPLTPELEAEGWVYEPIVGSNPLDAIWDFEVTPYLKQYVGNWWDANYTSAGYASDGETVTIRMPEFKKYIYRTPNQPQQIMQFGGAEFISSLGDLSRKYIDQFFASGARRLKDIILGNDTPGYSNKLMNNDTFKPDDSATMIKDGVSQPNENAKSLLEKVVLSNLSTLTGTVDFSGSEKLKELRAVGSGVTSFILADGVQIQKLHLPESVTNLILKEPTSLTGVLNSIEPTIEQIEEYSPITVYEEDYLNNPSLYYINTINGYKCCNDLEYFGQQYKLIDVTESTFDPSILYTLNNITGDFDPVNENASYNENIDYYIAQNYIDYNETRSYYKREIINETIYPDGLYIDGLTNKTVIEENDVTSLNVIDIIGGNMGYDSYDLLDKAVKIKQNMINRNNLGNNLDKHLLINLTNINWTPYRQVEFGEVALEDKVYYLLDDHDNLVIYNPIVPNTTEYSNWALNTINRKVYEYNANLLPDSDKDIVNLNLLDTFIGDYRNAKNHWNELVDKNLFDYERYNFFKSTDAYAQGPTLANLTGTIFINNDINEPIDEALIKNYYHDIYYPKLNIQVAHTVPALVAKFIEIDDETGAEKIWDTLKYSSVAIPEEYTPPTYPELSEVPASKLNYDFRGWSATYYTQAQVDAMTDEEVVDLILDNESVQDVLFANAQNNVIRLYAIYTIHGYEITFKYTDDTIIETKQVPVIDYIPVPSTVPYLDDSGLALTASYVFQGYTREKNGKILIPYTNDGKHLNIKPSSDLTLYASFIEVADIHNYPTDEKYFEITEDGRVKAATGYQLTGKIVIPNIIGGIEVTGIEGTDSPSNPERMKHGFFDQKNITHIFLQNPNTSILSVIEPNACGFMFSNDAPNKLRYIELPTQGGVMVYAGSFRNADYLFNDDDGTIGVDKTIEFFSRLKECGNQTFYGCRYAFTNGVYLLNNLTNVRQQAFNYCCLKPDSDSTKTTDIIIGAPDAGVTIGTDGVHGLTFSGSNLFGNSREATWHNITIYSNNTLEEWQNIINTYFDQYGFNYSGTLSVIPVN